MCTYAYTHMCISIIVPGHAGGAIPARIMLAPLDLGELDLGDSNATVLESSV